MTIAVEADKVKFSILLKAMYFELDSSAYKEDITSWLALASMHLERDIVILDHRGFFIMREETLPINKERIWNGVSVYIKPEFRKSKALKEYYKYMFDNFNGTILGFTEVNSEHNKVLLKRHKLLGYVYGLNR